MQRPQARGGKSSSTAPESSVPMGRLLKSFFPHPALKGRATNGSFLWNAGTLELRDESYDKQINFATLLI